MPANPPAQEDRREPALLVGVAPVVAEEGPPKVVRLVVIVLIVGVIAFLAGAQLGAGRTSPTLEPTAVPAPSSPAPGSPPPPQWPTDFAFAHSFRPDTLIAGIAGGAACVTRSGAVPGHTASRTGRSLVIVWLSSCPMPAGTPNAFVEQLFSALEREIPNARASTSRDVQGIAVTDFGYTDGASSGTVTLVVDAAGRDLLIAITLDEPIVP